MQVVHVSDASSVRQAQIAAQYIDGILLDSGSTSGNVRQLGGTSIAHDWSLSCEICSSVSKAVHLAGGLNSANIVEAIQRVRPFGVDVCSGVITQGSLDSEKFEKLVEAVHQAFEEVLRRKASSQKNLNTVRSVPPVETGLAHRSLATHEPSTRYRNCCQTKDRTKEL